MSAKAKLRLLTPNQLDGRTKARRIFDSICAAISADLAPEGDDQLTEIQKHLIVSFAGSALLQQNLIAVAHAGQHAAHHARGAGSCWQASRSTLPSSLTMRAACFAVLPGLAQSGAGNRRSPSMNTCDNRSLPSDTPHHVAQ